MATEGTLGGQRVYLLSSAERMISKKQILQAVPGIRTKNPVRFLTGSQAGFLLCIVFCITICCAPLFVRAESTDNEIIIAATGEDVLSDDHLPEEYRFPAKYRENAVQFRTQDDVLLCGYVIGEGSKTCLPLRRY